MIAFDASDLCHWANNPDAFHRLPELIRRLVMATVPMPSLLQMPSGSSVWRAGWDGLLVVNEGNVWVPPGASAWEFGSGKNPGDKATRDYRKRTKNTMGVDRTDTTFVFVTPRRWEGKSKWARGRREEGQWAGVGALDADDLIAWLEQAPAVAHWFARLIGKLPTTGIIPLDEWWENWSSISTPNISPELVTAGRQEQGDRVAQWFQGEPSHYYVQGDTQDEAIAFLAACAHADDAKWGPALLARAVVVETVDAWRSLEGHSSPLVLVRGFSGGNVSAQIAVGRGHHVLTPLGGHEDSKGDGFTLPRLGRDETVAALKAMGLSDERTRAIVRSTARRLQVIRRRLAEDAGVPAPDWASPSTPRSLVALVLVGQWDGDKEGDRAIVAEVAGQPYEAVEQDLVELMAAEDHPLTRIGSLWRFISHEEAWHLLAPKLTSSDLHRFERVATNVFGEMSPKFELPIEQRYMASVFGKSLPHSGTLREGMARTLALMGTHPDRAKNAQAASYVPARVVARVLAEGKGWQIWATLSGSLPTLAEASPEAILDAIQRDLDSSPSPFEALFAEEGDGFLEGTPHTGLLWALESMAWSQDYFARVAKILARLAEMDPGGRVANRPVESLCSLFLPMMRFSEVSDEHRLETLAMLLDAVPLAGWRVAVGAYPAQGGGVIVRDPPSWRPWDQDGASRLTVAEYHSFVRELERLLLAYVGGDAERWSSLVGILSSLSAEARQQGFELLSQQVKCLSQQPAANGLWDEIREVLHSHNSYPDAGWAMNSGDVAALEATYRELTPTDPVAAYAWLFDNWPHLPKGEPSECNEASERIATAQQAAIQAVFESSGTSAITDIAEAANMPHQVGVGVATGLDPGLTLDLALDHLASTSLKLRHMAYGALTALFSQFGWSTLDEAIARAKAGGLMPQALADIHLAAPARRETWQRLDNEAEEVRTCYWKSLRRPNSSVWDSEELAFAVQQLLSVQRSVDAVDWLWSRPLPHELVIQLLEAVPFDVAASPDRATRLSGYAVSDLFKKLDRSKAVPEHVVARLEIPYLEMLRTARPNLALHRQVTKEPSLFADVIFWAFKRADGQAEEPVDENALKHRAQVALNILWELHLIPGLMDDGSVDAEALSAWVNEARRLCGERDRQDIGDEQIGQLLANAPAGEDGIWPCEAVRDLLDELSTSNIGIGFTTGKTNLRGVTTRGAFDGGGQEEAIAEGYRRDAARLAARWPFTAQLLRNLAASFKYDARLYDNQADWDDQFWV